MRIRRAPCVVLDAYPVLSGRKSHKREVLRLYKAELSDARRYAESVTSSDDRKLWPDTVRSQIGGGEA